MKVYFVRHGESELTERFFQRPDTPLSKIGVIQAKSVAQRFKHIHIELIISSPYKRALDTALEIKNLINVPIIENNLLIERKMPSKFLGMEVNNKEIIPVLEMIHKHFFDPNWHYEDEENFEDLIDRARNAIETIQTYKNKNIAIVTHGYFLIVLIFYIIFTDDLRPKSFSLFRKHTEFSLTGLSLGEFKNEKWKMLSLNDLAHLGE